MGGNEACTMQYPRRVLVPCCFGGESPVRFGNFIVSLLREAKGLKEEESLCS